MKFRLGLNQAQGASSGTDALTQGVGNMFQGLAMLPLLRAQAAEEAQNGESKRRSLEAEIASHMSTAALNRSKAAAQELETSNLQARPGFIELGSASRAGLSVPEFKAGLSEMQHGTPVEGPRFLSEDIPGLGPSGRTAAFRDAINTLYVPAMATPADKLNWDQLAQARGHYQDQDIARQAVEAGNRGDDMTLSRLNSVRGKKEFTPFAAVGTTGTALNQVTGAQPVTNPAMNFLFNQGEQAQIGQRKAAANASNASARSSNASADKTREEIKLVGGNAWQYDSARGGRVNKLTGEFVPVTEAGKPIGPLKPPAQDGKPLPTSAAKGYLDNIQSLRQAEKALLLAEGKDIGDPAKGGSQGDAEATGWKGYLPNVLLNRMDPKGVETRAMIADLGSMVIHDRSGAAVTAAEFPRLAPFIPTVNDDAPTVQKKLRQFVANYRAIVADAENFYKASGYNVPALPETSAGGSSGPAPGTVENGYRFKGGNPADPKSWEKVK